MRELLVSPDHERSRSLGWLALAWIEHFVIHGPGDIQGATLRDIPLSDELAGHTLDVYALADDGRRLYDSVFFSRPKGADKSGHAARIGLFEGMGPCRFAGWARGGEVFEWMDFRYVYEPGEPMGRPVTYPFLRCMATEEGQTGNVYDSIYYNLREGPLRESLRHADDAGLTRVYLPGGGEIRPSTASSASKDGGKETWADFDETHLYILPELRRMYATVRRNMAKRKDAEPWSYETSTMYEVGRESVAEQSHKLAQMARKDRKLAPRFLFDHRQAPTNVDMSNDEAVTAALREAYGGADYMPFDRILGEIRDPRNDIADSVRYFFNQANAASEAAFDLVHWRSLLRKDYTPENGTLITLGFDGARRRDSTALVATEVETGFQWLVKEWAMPAGAESWSVDEQDVDATVAEVFRTYEVWRMYCDPPYWENTIARWAGQYGDKVVVSFPTNSPRRMSPAVQTFAHAIREGVLSHNGDERLATAIGNAKRENLNFYDDEGRPLWVFGKMGGKDSPNKIDAAVAACICWQARTDAIADGAQARPMVTGFFV